MKYFFTLGAHPLLSQAEILAVLKRSDITFTMLLDSPAVIIIETAAVIKPEFLQQLGGCIKFGQIKKTRHIKKFQSEDLLDLINYTGEKKFNFGISVYNNPKFKLTKTGLSIKRALKKNNLKVRFVIGKDNPLSSVIVAKNDLLDDNGMEIILIFTEDLIYIGQTQAVQDFEKYSQIDYGRPQRDDVSGMLPPKLAQIMINLAQTKTDQKILDPFCGSGTVLQMAALLGCTDLIGFDKSLNAVHDTEKNLNWLKQTRRLKFNAAIKHVDVLQLSKELPDSSIDVIVTEPFLGPPLKGAESDLQIQTNINELSSLYRSAFTQFTKILKPGGQIVFIIPEFKINKSYFNLEAADVFPDQFEILGRWQYSRVKQKVIRKIFLLQKKSAS